jgi:hypothetical protein
MPSTRTFSDVTAEILSRMKEFGRAEYGIVYDPPEGPISTATSRTLLGECVIEFAHDSSLEGDGFETLVLRHKTRGFPEHPGIAGVSITREG